MVRSGVDNYYKVFKPEGGSQRSALYTYGTDSLGFNTDDGKVGSVQDDRLFKMVPQNLIPQVTIQNINILNKDVISQASAATLKVPFEATEVVHIDKDATGG